MPDQPHQRFDVKPTSYVGALDSENRRADHYAVYHNPPPVHDAETGNIRIGLSVPLLIVCNYVHNQAAIAARVADILNTHWDDDLRRPLDPLADYLVKVTRNEHGHIRKVVVDQNGKEIGEAWVDESELLTVHAHVDDNGTAWTPPTAWAWFAKCRAIKSQTPALPISWRNEQALEVLYLGEIPVGRVNPGDKGWIFNLRGYQAFWKREKSLALARGNLSAALFDWARRAGILPAEDQP